VAVLDDLDVIAMKVNAAGGRHFEEIDAAQEGALARARSAEDRDDVMFPGDQGNALEYFDRTEGLVNVLDDERRGDIVVHGFTSFP
jgi:hypothetical protein